MNEPAPRGLKTRGRAFWKDTMAVYELERGERELLVEICRTLDRLDELTATVAGQGVTVPGSTGQTRAHPALVEIRGAQVVLSRLLGQLKLPDVDGGALATATSDAARAAATARWHRPRVPRGAA